MLKLMEDQRTELLKNYQGGDGALEVRHIVEEDSEKYPHLYMVCKATLNPGSSVGDHGHEGLTEVIYILSGLARYNDGKETILRPGDAAIVTGDEHQSLCCVGDEPMTYLACILRT